MKNTVGLCCGCGYIKTIVCEGLCGKCLAENLSKSDNSKVVALAKWAIQKPPIARILV